MDFITVKWFADDHPINAAKASATIGAGENGVVTITADNYGTEGNDYTIQVVVPDAISADLDATLTGNDIVVSLATDVSKAADDTKNTAALIATEIAKIDGITATKSGNGSTPISAAIAKKSLAGGLYATETPVPCMMIIGTDLYIAPTPIGHIGTGWVKVQLTAV